MSELVKRDDSWLAADSVSQSVVRVAGGECHPQTHRWFQSQLEDAKRQLQIAQDELTAAKAAGFDLRRFGRAVRERERREVFYEKCVFAADNGFVVVPPVQAEQFAVRRWEDDGPCRQDELGDRWHIRPEPIEAIPLGEGSYYDAMPASQNYTRWVRDANGDVNPRKAIRATELVKVDFPPSVQNVCMIQAVHAAMDLRVFDDFTVCPQRGRTKQDPMVYGRIAHWRKSRQPLCFLVGWYVDLRLID